MNCEKREWNLDLLRIFSCILVIMVHVSAKNLLLFLPKGKEFMIVHVYNALGHIGTIQFLMISGALLLSENYVFEWKKFFLRNILPLFTAYYAWVVLFRILVVFTGGTFGPAELKNEMINIILGNGGYHFWYVPVLLGIYLILPLLRPICHAGKKVLLYFLTLFFVVQVVFRTVSFFEFPNQYLVMSLLERIPFTLINHYTGYFVMGYFLTKVLKDRKDKKIVLLGGALLICGLLTGAMGDMFLNRQSGQVDSVLNDIFSIPMFMNAIGLFLLFSQIKITVSMGWGKWIAKLSGLTFGIYMFHPMVLEIIWERVQRTNLPAILTVPLCTLIVFCCCLVVIAIVSKIPVIGRWLLFLKPEKKKI